MNTKKPVKNRFFDIVDRLKSSHLMLLMGGLFLLDLFIPDPLPLIDEAVLGLATLLVARWQLRRTSPGAASSPPPEGKPKVKNVTPPDLQEGDPQD
jgi:hypothetical protein